MNAPAGKSELVSLELVEFNSSVTLSQLYAVLGKVAKEVGKVYEKSGDKTLAQLAQGYYTMEEEAKGLSKLVEKQLPKYNKEILQSFAILMDQIECALPCLFCVLETGIVIWSCWPCFAPCIFVFTLWTCALCLLTYCIIASIPTIIQFAGAVYSCHECAHCLGYL